MVLPDHTTQSNSAYKTNIDNSIAAVNVDIFTLTVVTSGGAYTFGSNSEGILIINETEDVTVDLPTAASYSDRVIYIKNIMSVNTITIDGNTTETIDGELTILLDTQYQAVKLVSDGSNWHII